MNTKIFIISIALILLFPNSVSVGASSQKHIISIQTEAQLNAPADSKHNDKSLDWIFDWSYTDGVHHSQSDDDNKAHHYHYDRLSRNRRRILLSILIKILLFITHISSLLFATIHLLH